MEPAARRKYTLFGVVFAVALAADQLTKVWARHALAPLRHLPPPADDALPVIRGWFELQYSENPFSAFGLGGIFGRDNARWVLLAIGVVACVVVYRLLRKTRPENRRVIAELGLLAGGALGNMFDRVVHARVTDFIVWKFPESSSLCEKARGWFGTCQWPTFNLADAFLVVGVIALLFHMKGDKEEAKEATEAKPKSRKKR